MKKHTVKNNSVGILIIAVTALLVVSSLIVLQNNNSSLLIESQSSQNLPTLKNPTQIIKITQNGFEPQYVTVKPETTVVWKNVSNSSASINSDDHSNHTLHPFLNLGEVATGFSVQVKMADIGIFEYHNHNKPSQTGTIEVR